MCLLKNEIHEANYCTFNVRKKNSNLHCVLSHNPDKIKKIIQKRDTCKVKKLYCYIGD